MVFPSLHTASIGTRIEDLRGVYRNAHGVDVLRQFCFGASSIDDVPRKIAFHCRDAISHIGFEVENIEGTLNELSESGFHFAMRKPPVVSQGIPKRFDGSQGKIALVSDTDDMLRFELFEVVWREPFARMDPRDRSRLIDHVAIEAVSKDSLNSVAAIIEGCSADISVELPVTENLAERSAFFYARNKRGDRIEFISYG